MDQITAMKRFIDGGIFIFLDVPNGTEFGVDMKSWNTGENFKGVKMIPSGLHYFFYSSVSRTGDTAPRTGFYHNFNKGELLVKRWNQKDEEVSLEEVTEQEKDHLRTNILALDKFLGPFPYEIQSKWRTLTSNITDELIARLQPESFLIRSALELLPCSNEERLKADLNYSEPKSQPKRVRLSCSEEAEESMLPKLVPKAGTGLRPTSLPERNYPENSTPTEITQHSLDLSYSLEQVISTYQKPIDVLGEIQFMYICFLVGHSLEAFEQWKKLVSLLCSCETAVKKYRYIYDAFITILELQVTEIPEDFLADIVSNNNFIYSKLRLLFRSIASIDVDGILKSKATRFRQQLTDTYSWDFSHLESDDEEDAPSIVKLRGG